MGKLSNTITMLQLLNTGKKYTVNELSKILEVTPRMIRSYKEELDKAGIYIDTIMGPYGGYVLNQSIRMPVRKFRKKDVDLLNRVSSKLNDEQLKNDLYILTDKVRGVFKGSKEEAKELDIHEVSDKYNALTRAIKEKRKVKITYYSYNKGENVRIIDPIELFLFSDGWYVAAYCELRQDIRHFELKRIREFELLKENYE
jgi:predicted DNA-binding transcriptional regulator YafY